jgi:hypothetical protein
MADFPAWDYWAWDDLPDGRRKIVDTTDWALWESDIRNNIYALDVKKWCGRKRFYWTPQEAALISFGRDPDKVERTEDDFVFHDDVFGPSSSDDDDDQKKSYELRQYIFDVHEAILHALEAGELPRRIPRERYIEWATDAGIDVPLSVVEAIDAFERDRERDADIAERSDSMRPNNSASQSERDAVNAEEPKLHETSLTQLVKDHDSGGLDEKVKKAALA